MTWRRRKGYKQSDNERLISGAEAFLRDPNHQLSPSSAVAAAADVVSEDMLHLQHAVNEIAFTEVLKQDERQKSRHELVRRIGYKVLQSFVGAGLVTGMGATGHYAWERYNDAKLPYHKLGMMEPSRGDGVKDCEAAFLNQELLPVAHGTAVIVRYSGPFSSQPSSITRINNPIVVYNNLATAWERSKQGHDLASFGSDVVAFAGRNTAAMGRQSLLQVYPLHSNKGEDVVESSFIPRAGVEELVTLEQLHYGDSDIAADYFTTYGANRTTLEHEPIGLVSG